MRRLLKSTLLLALALNLLVPSNAHANKWLAWLEELSGPGPYDGFLITADVACLGSSPSDPEAFGLFLYSVVKVYSRSEQAAIEMFDGFMTRMNSRPDQKLTEAELKLFTAGLSGDISTLRASIKGTSGETTAGSKPPDFGALWEEYQRQQRRFRKCRVDRSNNLLSVQLEVGRFKDDLKGDRYEGTTNLTSISAIAYLPIERLLVWDWKRPLSRAGRAVELGMGVGAYGLRGSTLRDDDMWRGVVPFRLRVIPSELVYALVKQGRAKAGLNVALNPRTEPNRWRRLLQSFEYRVGRDLVLGTLDSDLFGDAGPTTTDQTHEWVSSHGFNVDLGIAFRALIGH